MKGRTNVSGTGNLEIDGDIELFEVAEGNNIIAGSFVELTGENASINQLKSISNSSCGVAKISDDMIVLFSYVPKSTNLSASVVKMNEIIKTYNFILDYTISSNLKYIVFHTHVIENKIYLSYDIAYNNDTANPANEKYGTKASPLVRYITEIEFDEDGNLSKVKDYTVDFSGLAESIDKFTSPTYAGGDFIFYDGNFYLPVICAQNASSLSIGEKYCALIKFAISNNTLTYDSTLLIKKISNYANIENIEILSNGKLFINCLSLFQSQSTKSISTEFFLYNIESNIVSELKWEGGSYIKSVNLVIRNNNIFIICRTQSSTSNAGIFAVLFQINSDLSISHKQEETLYQLNAFDSIFDCCYLESSDDNDCLICYTTGNYTYRAYIIKYESLGNNFLFSDFTLPTTNENLRMYSSTDDLLRFAIPLKDNEKRTVVYLKNGNSTTNSLIASNFICQDEEIIFAESLDLVKNYESRINGVARTSGSSGDKIQVSVPKTN